MITHTVADPGVVRLVRSNPPDRAPSLPRVIANIFQWKKLIVPVILDVKLHYFGSLGLVYYSYNQETYRFFRRLSSGSTVQR